MPEKSDAVIHLQSDSEDEDFNQENQADPDLESKERESYFIHQDLLDQDQS